MDFSPTRRPRAIGLVLSARLSRWSILVLLMLTFALANGLGALAPSFSWMLAHRFVSGLPHGAYFGIAAPIAASLVPAERRTWAVGRVMLGLTIATILGVPAANWLGQEFGWRWGFGIAAILALLCVGMVVLLAPRDASSDQASPLAELTALKRG